MRGVNFGVRLAAMLLLFGSTSVARTENGSSRSRWVLDLRIESLADRYAVSPDGRMLVTGGNQQTGVVYDTHTGARLYELTGCPKDENRWFNSFAFSHDSKLIAASGCGGQVLTFEASSGRLLAQLKPSQAQLATVTFSPDDGKIAAFNADQTITIWNVRDGRRLFSLGTARSDGGVPRSQVLTFTPDGERLLSVNKNGTIDVWAVGTGRLAARFALLAGPAESLAISPDGRFVAIGGRQGLVRILDSTTGTVLQSFVGHAGDVLSVGYSVDGRKLVTGASDRSARVWDLAVDEEIAALAAKDRAPIGFVGFLADGRVVLGENTSGVAFWRNPALRTLDRGEKQESDFERMDESSPR